MRRVTQRAASKTMNDIPEIKIEFIKDGSGKSERRTKEATEVIFQMILLAKKRGRPLKSDREEQNAA